MRRWAVVLLAINAGCEEPVEQAAPLPAFVYPPRPSAWPLVASRGAIGRAQAPQLASRGGITGSDFPFRNPTPWQVPGAGPARAIVSGELSNERGGIELIDIDSGRQLWRTTACDQSAVVGVTANTAVCLGDRGGIHGIGLDGTTRWSHDGTFLVMTGRLILFAGEAAELIYDADTGAEIGRVKLDTDKTFLAVCGAAGRELFATTGGKRLERIIDGTVTWSIPLDGVVAFEGCDGPSLLATVRTATGTTLVSITRETGKETGRIENVFGHWMARDGSSKIEIATETAVIRVARDLAGARETLEPLPLGELIAERGELRLVRASARTAVLLDRAGVRAYLPLATAKAALGDHALVAATSTPASQGDTLHRVIYPPRYDRTLRLTRGPRPTIALPAELRDLPRPGEPTPPLPSNPAITAVVGVIGNELYALTSRESGITAFDLPTRKMLWHHRDSCVSALLAASPGQLVCRNRDAVVRVSQDGYVWSWETEAIDTLDAAGNVVLVRGGHRLHVLDARTGLEGAMLESEDAGALPAAAIEVGTSTMLVTAEANRVIGRLPDVQMVPAWSLDVHGVVERIQAAGEGALVTLEDGDTYRIDARTGAATALPAIGHDWQVAGDLITSTGDGGPIPPAGWPPAPAPSIAAPKKRKGATSKPADDAPPPRLMTTIPPPANLEPSWQYSFFELTGALRVRNDYGLARPVTPATARTAGAPLVVVSGKDHRDALVIDPVQGNPLRRVRLPEDAVWGAAFSTVVDGKPVVGTLLANPLRVLLF